MHDQVKEYPEFCRCLLFLSCGEMPARNRVMWKGVGGCALTVESGAEAEVKRRLDEAARFIDLDQVSLSPQCGFASTEEGNLLAEEQQWAKLRMIVEVAEEVWGR